MTIELAEDDCVDCIVLLADDDDVDDRDGCVDLVRIEVPVEVRLGFDVEDVVDVPDTVRLLVADSVDVVLDEDDLEGLGVTVAIEDADAVELGYDDAVTLFVDVVVLDIKLELVPVRVDVTLGVCKADALDVFDPIEDNVGNAVGFAVTDGQDVIVGCLVARLESVEVAVFVDVLDDVAVRVGKSSPAARTRGYGSTDMCVETCPIVAHVKSKKIPVRSPIPFLSIYIK